MGTVHFDERRDHSVAFEIDADGAWTLAGTGDEVLLQSPPSSGLVTLDLTNKGASYFSVWAYSPDDGDLLVAESGDYSGQVREPDGTFLLEINATGGTWAITPG